MVSFRYMFVLNDCHRATFLFNSSLKRVWFNEMKNEKSSGIYLRQLVKKGKNKSIWTMMGVRSGHFGTIWDNMGHFRAYWNNTKTVWGVWIYPVRSKLFSPIIGSFQRVSVTDWRTHGRTDRLSYRDVRTHLKTNIFMGFL